jgi:hypothetical protein
MTSRAPSFQVRVDILTQTAALSTIREGIFVRIITICAFGSLRFDLTLETSFEQGRTRRTTILLVGKIIFFNITTHCSRNVEVICRVTYWTSSHSFYDIASLATSDQGSTGRTTAFIIRKFILATPAAPTTWYFIAPFMITGRTWNSIGDIITRNTSLDLGRTGNATSLLIGIIFRISITASCTRQLISCRCMARYTFNITLLKLTVGASCNEGRTGRASDTIRVELGCCIAAGGTGPSKPIITIAECTFYLSIGIIAGITSFDEDVAGGTSIKIIREDACVHVAACSSRKLEVIACITNLACCTFGLILAL